MTISVSPLIGAANLSDVRTTADGPLFPLGTSVTLNDGGRAIYIQAASELSTFSAVGIRSDYKAQMLTTTLAASTRVFAAAQVSIASGYYGWVQQGGSFKVNLNTNCDDNVPLYTTATAGVLDDATVSGGLIGGIVSTVTISTATAVTCYGMNPFIVNGATPGA